MEEAEERSSVSSSILVRLAGIMCDTCGQSEVSIISEDQSEVSIVSEDQSDVSIITCSKAGLSLSLDKVRINSVRMHRRMFLEKVNCISLGFDKKSPTLLLKLSRNHNK